MTGFEAYSLYNAIKLHFTTDSYDFFRYGGKTKSKLESFENRKDKYYFYKLSRKYPNKEEYVDFLVSNFAEKEKLWVGDLLSDEAYDNFSNKQKFIQSLSYKFENDCHTIFDELDNPNDAIKTNGEYPKLLTKAFRKEINFESLCILNGILNFLPMWKEKITDTIRFPQYAKKIEKFSCFLPKDNVKYKTILRKVIG